MTLLYNWCDSKLNQICNCLPPLYDQYIHNLGVPKEWQFVDVYGLEPDLLGMVPKPVAAVVLLFPITDKVSLPKLSSVPLKWIISKHTRYIDLGECQGGVDPFPLSHKK